MSNRKLVIIGGDAAEKRSWFCPGLLSHNNLNVI